MKSMLTVYRWKALSRQSVELSNLLSMFEAPPPHANEDVRDRPSASVMVAGIEAIMMHIDLVRVDAACYVFADLIVIVNKLVTVY